MTITFWSFSSSPLIMSLWHSPPNRRTAWPRNFKFVLFSLAGILIHKSMFFPCQNFIPGDVVLNVLLQWTSGGGGESKCLRSKYFLTLGRHHIFPAIFLQWSNAVLCYFNHFTESCSMNLAGSSNKQHLNLIVTKCLVRSGCDATAWSWVLILSHAKLVYYHRVMVHVCLYLT